MPLHQKFVAMAPRGIWKGCLQCGRKVPAFLNMPRELKERIRTMTLEGDPLRAISELRQATGCSKQDAMDFVRHPDGPVQTPNIITKPCPKCGKSLRTPRAKQCRWCGRLEDSH